MADKSKADKQKPQAAQETQVDEGPLGFFEKIISFFLGTNDPERIKKRQLKQIAKELKQYKIKFYNSRQEVVQPALANFFYEIYKTLGPARLLLDRSKSSSVLKSIFVDAPLNQDQKEVKERLQEQNIRKLAEKKEIKAVSNYVKQNLVDLFSFYNAETIRQINKNYGLFLFIINLASFDYYFMLKKFDSSLPENDFVYSPQFESINGEYIVEDIKDFLEVLPPVNIHEDWDHVIEILRQFKDIEVISKQNWKKVVNHLSQVQKSRILIKIVQHLDKDPEWQIDIKFPEDRIVQDHLNAIKHKAEDVIQKIVHERRNNKMNKLVEMVFGSSVSSRMKYYTDKNSQAYESKINQGFKYYQGCNYLKAFLLDFVKKDIRETVNPLIVTGKWSHNVLSQQLSDSFHQLMGLSDKLIEFDESLAEEGGLGQRLKFGLLRVDKDGRNKASLQQTIIEINEKAALIIDSAVQNLLQMGRIIKQVIEDSKKQPGEVILNWKAIDNIFEGRSRERLSSVYKRIYYFIQLQQYFIKPQTTPTEEEA